MDFFFGFLLGRIFSSRNSQDENSGDCDMSLKARAQCLLYFGMVMMLTSLFLLVHASLDTYHKALRFTQEQTTFEQPELEPFVTYHAMVNFKKVRLTTWDGTQILRQVWVTPTDPDDMMVDVQVDPRLNNDLRLTVIPEFSSHIVGYSGLIRARHVTLWVPNKTAKKYWDTWLAKQMEAYRVVAEI